MIEQRFKEAIDRWVADACPMGSFINAVLENDLAQALGRADEDARENLHDIVKYLYNQAPSSCWGSKEKVNQWREKKRQISEGESKIIPTNH
jgi:hypothetical protein